MARIRSIKPEFFMHEGLADLSPLHRLFFVGLWTLADRTGKLENRPKRIKASILPWENCDVAQLIADLAAAGFIQTYEADGLACIRIPGFGSHQKPHPKELPFGLPEPEKDPASRKKIRLAAPNQPGIPSRPAGGGVLSMDVGLLVSGGQPPPPHESLAPTPAAKPWTPPLIERLADVYRRIRGAPYPLDARMDEVAVRRLFGLTMDEAEIERRWAIALRRDGYPSCGTLAELAQQKVWSAAAADPPGKPKDVRRGRVAAEDVDWSNQQSEVSNEF